MLDSLAITESALSLHCFKELCKWFITCFRTETERSLLQLVTAVIHTVLKRKQVVGGQ